MALVDEGLPFHRKHFKERKRRIKEEDRRARLVLVEKCPRAVGR